MEESYKIVWTGIKSNHRMWGYILTKDGYKPHYYSFWGSVGGSLMFAKSYPWHNSLRKKQRMYSELSEDKLEIEGQNIIKQFEQYLLFHKLKNEIYR